MERQDNMNVISPRSFDEIESNLTCPLPSCIQEESCQAPRVQNYFNRKSLVRVPEVYDLNLNSQWGCFEVEILPENPILQVQEEANVQNNLDKTKPSQSYISTLYLQEACEIQKQRLWSMEKTRRKLQKKERKSRKIYVNRIGILEQILVSIVNADKRKPMYTVYHH